jgi:DNA polymerase III epsilon subunit-like protein
MDETFPIADAQESTLDRTEIFNRGREIVLNAPQLYVDVDVEADGIAGHGSMLSIGAQSPTGESFYSEIKPAYEEFKQGNREFCEQHGLPRQRLLVEAPDYHEVMTKFQAWLNNLQEQTGKKPIFTAFNAAFDWGFVDLYFLKSGIEKNPFGIAPFDLKSLALPLTGNWDWSLTSKGKLPALIIPDGDFTHHALEDAQYQQKLHFGMAALLGSRQYLQYTNNATN